MIKNDLEQQKDHISSSVMVWIGCGTQTSNLSFGSLNL